MPCSIIDYVCLGIFTVEFVLRLATCPALLPFIKSPMNLIDFLAVAPFYVELLVVAAGHESSGASSTRVLRLIRLLRVLRLLRLWNRCGGMACWTRHVEMRIGCSQCHNSHLDPGAPCRTCSYIGPAAGAGGVLASGWAVGVALLLRQSYRTAHKAPHPNGLFRCMEVVDGRQLLPRHCDMCMPAASRDVIYMLQMVVHSAGSRT